MLSKCWQSKRKFKELHGPNATWQVEWGENQGHSKSTNNKAISSPAQKDNWKTLSVPRYPMIWACRDHASPLLFSTNLISFPMEEVAVFSVLSQKRIPRALDRSDQPRNQESRPGRSLAPPTGPSRSAPALNHFQTPIKHPLCAWHWGPSGDSQSSLPYFVFL